MLLKTSIEKLMQGQNLDSQTCRQALTEMMATDANPLQTAAFLVLLRSKTETPEELSGMVAALKAKMITIDTPHRLLDIVGTGGDGAHTINISTGSAILAASCGVKIAKHGNRAVTSLAGSADVLEALGVNIHLSPEKIAAGIEEIGIGFCFSPNFHPAIRELRQLRRDLNVPTTFNILGPLLNPANPAHFLMGVYHESLMAPMAQTLKQMGVQRSIVAHGIGLDEISCAGPVRVLEISGAEIHESIIDAEKYGLGRCHLTDLQGGNAHDNAEKLLEVFSGQYSHPAAKAIADTLILNAAVALYLYGLHSSIAEAIRHAQESLFSARALILLKKWIAFTHD
jgi:anthranilate phosphoribosyltransferase